MDHSPNVEWISFFPLINELRGLELDCELLFQVVVVIILLSL